MWSNGNTEKLAETARTEKDAGVRQAAIEALASHKGPNITAALVAMYGSVLAGLLWRRTGIRFFQRWTYRLSWILPLLLWWAYYHKAHLPPGKIITHSLEEYFYFQALLIVRDEEIFAALIIPYLTAAICVLALLPHMMCRLKQILARQYEHLRAAIRSKRSS